MTDLHFVFTLYLWFSDEEGNFVEEKQYPIKNKNINKDIMDYINSNNDR